MMTAANAAVPTHSDLSEMPPLARWGRALQALGRVLADPDRTDEVIVFSHYVNAGSAGTRFERFYGTPEGRALFEQGRAIDSQHVDLAALAALPPDTLGYAYAEFLRSRGFSPDVFQAPVDISDARHAYVIQRIRQTHDLWHVVTGHTTDPAGEIALQAFTYAQVGAPSSLILAAMGTLRGLRQRPRLPFEAIAAYRRGRDAQAFATFLWEDHWATPLKEVRALLGVEVAPQAVAA